MSFASKKTAFSELELVRIAPDWEARVKKGKQLSIEFQCVPRLASKFKKQPKCVFAFETAVRLKFPICSILPATRSKREMTDIETKLR